MSKSTNAMKQQIRAVLCQLRYDPNVWTIKTPVAIVKDMTVRKAPRFLGLVYSPMRTGPSVALIPIETPWRNLATRREATLEAVRTHTHPTIMGVMLTRFAVLLPYLAIMVGAMKLPATRAKPRIEAGIERM